jgi:SAM-dependent methyltransferase
MTSWDERWDDVYAQQGFRAKYPDEFVVRFVAVRFFTIGVGLRKKIRILDLGCGPGRHVIFLAREGFQAFGVDASTEAIRLCRNTLKKERLQARVRVADFIALPYPDGYFDAIIDCASMMHNRLSNVRRILREVKRTLKKGGEFLSMMRTNRDYAYGQARRIEPGTFTDYRDFDLKGLGIIHFFRQSEVEKLFSIFKTVHCEYSERTFNDRRKKITHWVVTGQK